MRAFCRDTRLARFSCSSIPHPPIPNSKHLFTSKTTLNCSKNACIYKDRDSPYSPNGGVPGFWKRNDFWKQRHFADKLGQQESQPRISSWALSEKIKYIMYDLTKFTKTFEDLKNDEDRWLYLLKHAGSAENLPDFNDDVIAKAINRLLVNKASDKLLKEQADDMVFTEEQLDRMALARVRARAIVLAEGEQKKAREMARALKTMDVPIEKIVAASGLTQAEVEAL